MFNSPGYRILVALLRPQTFILMCLYFVGGIVYGLYRSDAELISFIRENFVETCSCVAGVAFWYIAGTAMNDYADYEIDIINLAKDKQRPLVAGLISREELLKLSVSASLLSLCCAMFTSNFKIIVLFCVLLILNWAYSFKPFQISRRGGLAPALLPLGYVALTVLSGMFLVTESITSLHITLVATFYIHFLSRILLKDYRDVIGDKKAGKATLLLKKGNVYITKLSSLLYLSSTLAFIYLVPRDKYKLTSYFVFISFIAVWSLYKLSKESEWMFQKVYIPMYGRMCTALVASFIFVLVTTIENLSMFRVHLTLVAMVSLFVWSMLDIIRIQKLKT